jgi:hypothetical protein
MYKKRTEEQNSNVSRENFVNTVNQVCGDFVLGLYFISFTEEAQINCYSEIYWSGI